MNANDLPLAVKPFTSYRLKGPFGWIMLAAMSPEEAMAEAARSTPNPQRENLEVWAGSKYTPV